MSSTFTPGPWSVGKKTGTLIFTGPDGGMGDFICEVSGEDDTPREVNKANARLIASSPELYEALKAILPYAQHADSCGDMDAYNNAVVQSCGCGLDSTIEHVRAALSKAAGEGM